MIYTIGHGGTKVDKVIERMEALGIEILVDVRTKPFSRWQPEFNLAKLRDRLGEAYLWRKDLGGLGDEITDESLEWLVRFAATRNVVIMCSERDPHKCHRHHKIATRLWLRTPRVPVIHLRHNGTQHPAFSDGDAPAHPLKPAQTTMLSLFSL